MENKFIHVRNLEKYHPTYKDRELKWAKIYFQMVQGDPDCELIDNEIDWGRLIKFILLELQAKKPIPLNDAYLTKKGFNIKKRPMSLTLKMLQNFIEVVTELSEVCALEIDKEVDKEIDKTRVTEIESSWNSFASKHGLARVVGIIGKRRSNLNQRLKENQFDFGKILECIEKSDFLLGKINNDRKWKVDFDFIIASTTNYLKILEGKYSNVNSDKIKLSER